MEAAVRAIGPTPVSWELLHPSLVAEAPPSRRHHEAPGEGAADRDTGQAADRHAPRDPGGSQGAQHVHRGARRREERG